jgi:hypothetical protein
MFLGLARIREMNGSKPGLKPTVLPKFSYVLQAVVGWYGFHIRSFTSSVTLPRQSRRISFKSATGTFVRMRALHIISFVIAAVGAT